MPMYNLIEDSDNFSKNIKKFTATALTDAGTLDNFRGNSASFKYKQKTTGLTGNNGKKAVRIIEIFK